MSDLLTTLEPPSTRPEETIAKATDTALAQIKASATPPPGDDFDWRNDDSIICQEQPATAVYMNPPGGVVIRQERAWDVEDDPFVYFSSREAALALLAALQRLLKARGSS